MESNPLQNEKIAEEMEIIKNHATFLQSQLETAQETIKLLEYMRESNQISEENSNLLKQLQNDLVSMVKDLDQTTMKFVTMMLQKPSLDTEQIVMNKHEIEKHGVNPIPNEGIGIMTKVPKLLVSPFITGVIPFGTDEQNYNEQLKTVNRRSNTILSNGELTEEVTKKAEAANKLEEEEAKKGNRTIFEESKVCFEQLPIKEKQLDQLKKQVLANQIRLELLKERNAEINENINLLKYGSEGEEEKEDEEGGEEEDNKQDVSEVSEFVEEYTARLNDHIEAKNELEISNRKTKNQSSKKTIQILAETIDELEGEETSDTENEFQMYLKNDRDIRSNIIKFLNLAKYHSSESFDPQRNEDANNTKDNTSGYYSPNEYKYRNEDPDNNKNNTGRYKYRNEDPDNNKNNTGRYKYRGEDPDNNKNNTDRYKYRDEDPDNNKNNTGRYKHRNEDPNYNNTDRYSPSEYKDRNERGHITVYSNNPGRFQDDSQGCYNNADLKKNMTRFDTNSKTTQDWTHAQILELFDNKEREQLVTFLKQIQTKQDTIAKLEKELIEFIEQLQEKCLKDNSVSKDLEMNINIRSNRRSDDDFEATQMKQKQVMEMLRNKQNMENKYKNQTKLMDTLEVGVSRSTNMLERDLKDQKNNHLHVKARMCTLKEKLKECENNSTAFERNENMLKENLTIVTGEIKKKREEFENKKILVKKLKARIEQFERNYPHVSMLTKC